MAISDRLSSFDNSDYSLFKKNQIPENQIEKIYKDLKVNPKKPNPWQV